MVAVAGIAEKNNIYFLKQNINMYIHNILEEEKERDGENPPRRKMIIYTITLAGIFAERPRISMYVFIYVYIIYIHSGSDRCGRGEEG